MKSARKDPLTLEKTHKLLPAEVGYVDFDDPSAIGTIIQSGQSFAVIASTYDAGTTFAHTHLQVYMQYPLWHPSAINPLNSGLFAPNDPGGVYPVIGPVYFKRDNAYIAPGTPGYPNLWGKIEIISQITDFMGHNEDNPGNKIDSDTFHSNGQRYHGITSTPYKVEYAVVDEQGRVVKSTEGYAFSGNPDDAKMATLYEHDKDVDGNPNPNQTLPYNYVFNLTNSVADRYWNTRLSAGQPWNGTEAKINGAGSNSSYRAEYPDGEYLIRISAWDVIKSTSHFTDVMVDNFRPFLEHAEIKNSDGEIKYQRTWNLNGSTLAASGQGAVILGSGTHSVNLRFSEPVTDVTITIGTSTPVQVLLNPTGDKQNFTVGIPAAVLESLIDGDHILTV